MGQSLVGIHSTHRQCYFKRCNSPTPALETAVPISVLLWDAVGAGAAKTRPAPSSPHVFRLGEHFLVVVYTAVVMQIQRGKNYFLFSKRKN